MSDIITDGDLTIQRVVEQEAAIFEALTFLPGLGKDMLEENRHWMTPWALDPVSLKLVFCFQSYIITTPHHTILVDSCIGNEKNRPAYPYWHMKRDDAFHRGLAALGLSVNDIDVVMCTHLHVDHVGWNTRLENGAWVPTFPNARYLFSKREYDHWIEQNGKTPLPHIQDSVIPIVEAKRADFVTSDHEVDDHVRLTPTPGHTPDHFAVLIGKKEFEYRPDRRPDSLAPPSPIPGTLHAGRLRSRSGGAHPAQLSRAALRGRYAVLYGALSVALPLPTEPLG